MSIFSTEPIVPMRQRVREGKTNAANVCVLLFFFYNPKQEHEQGDASHKKQSLCVSLFIFFFLLVEACAKYVSFIVYNTVAYAKSVSSGEEHNPLVSLQLPFIQ